MLLAADIRLAGLPLGVEGVEFLLEPFLGRFARVDRAADAAAARVLWRVLARGLYPPGTTLSLSHERSPRFAVQPGDASAPSATVMSCQVSIDGAVCSGGARRPASSGSI